MEKYIGRVVTVIYQDRKGRITKRQIRVSDVRHGIVRAYCYTAGKPHTFRMDGILAVQPSAGRQSG